MPSNCGAGEDSWKPLNNQEIKWVNLKGNQPWILIERTYAEAEAPVFWSLDANSQLIGKVPDVGKDWGQGKRALDNEMVGWYHQCNGHEFGQTLGDGQRPGGLAYCSSWDCKESEMTGQLNNNSQYYLYGRHQRWQRFFLQREREKERECVCFPCNNLPNVRRKRRNIDRIGQRKEALMCERVRSEVEVIKLWVT